MLTNLAFPPVTCSEEHPCPNGLTLTAQSHPSGHALAQAAQADWLALEARSNCSFFQSWLWIGTWLKVVVADKPATLIRILDGGALIGLGVLILTRRGGGPLARRFLSLNDIPFSPYDMFIEKNGCLAVAGREGDIHQALIDFVCRTRALRFDELLISAAARDGLDPGTISLPRTFSLGVTKSQHCWYIDLADTDGNLESLLSRLSRNKRHQIRRTLTLYRETVGEDAAIEEAGSPERMDAFLASMECLHTAYWVARGRAGSFRNPLWSSFHRTLAADSLQAGSLSLLRAGSPGGELGYLYNHYWRGEALNIQSGFNYRADNRWKPGYAAHLLAAIHSAGRGCLRYDLLVGDDVYKSAIGQAGVELVWLRLPRLTWQYSALTVANRSRRRLGRLMSRVEAPGREMPGSSARARRDSDAPAAAIGRPPAVVLASGINALGVVRALGQRGIEVIAVSGSATSPAMRSRYAKERHLVAGTANGQAPATGEAQDFQDVAPRTPGSRNPAPINKAAPPLTPLNKGGRGDPAASTPPPIPPRDAALLDTLAPLAARRPVLIATGDEYAEFLQDQQVRLRAMGFRFVIPPETIISLFNDKRSEMEFIERTGVPHPATLVRLPASAGEILSRLRLPLIIKPRRSEGYKVIKAKNVIATTVDELEAFLEQYAEVLDRFLAQEIIPGGDDNLWVCNCCFGPDSELLSAFVFQRLGTSPPHYGVTTAALSIDNPAIIDIVARIGKGCRYVGPAMFEFKYDQRDGEYKYIEVNPRLGMCNWFDTLCGVDNAYLTYQLAADAAAVPRQRRPQQEGRYFLNFLADLYSRVADGQDPRSIACLYARILPRRKVWAVHTWSDPWPGVASLGEQLRYGFRAFAKRIRRRY